MALKIECEGVDGSGKTTALKYLIKQLEDASLSVLETREVGSPLIPVNQKLREVVLDKNSNLSGEAMELIFSAMRFENDRLYKTLDEAYDVIVSDRGWLSHLAYTDHNVNVDYTKALYLDFIAKKTQMPDIVVYLSINTDTALKRRVDRGEVMDVIESKGVEFQENVRKSFEKYLKHPSLNRTRVFMVDANKTIEEVQEQIDEIVKGITALVSLNLVGLPDAQCMLD